SVPLDLPLAGGALMARLHGSKERWDLLCREDAEPHDRLAVDRVRFLRHSRGGAAMMPSRLPELSDLRTGELDHLPSHFAAGPGHRGQDKADLGECVARRVPRDVEHTKGEPCRKPAA